MEEIIVVRYRKTGRLVYMRKFSCELNVNDIIVGITDRGEELGRVVKKILKSDVPEGVEIENIVRKAGKYDLETDKENIIEAEKVVEYVKEESKKLNLNMKILSAEYTLDKSKVIIYFTASERVDFRELVKELTHKIRARIELRQIGARDEIKLYPNLGVCGREVCCRTFLQDFKSVTIKDAKDQGLQINMPKLSGACQRLKCCLKYEEESYRENLSKLPKVGSIVMVNDTKEKGKVVNLDILNMKVKVRFGNTREDEEYKTYNSDEVKGGEN
ncbi:MAG: regulatory iron-sulfur-containing complex subunit RicT [Clostridia bacterium]